MSLVWRAELHEGRGAVGKVEVLVEEAVHRDTPAAWVAPPPPHAAGAVVAAVARDGVVAAAAGVAVVDGEHEGSDTRALWLSPMLWLHRLFRTHRP